MTRWNWKRWSCAIAIGSALAGTVAVAADLPKAGETIIVKSPGQPDRTVTVVKATKKPDGSVETEVKDAKNGETFTLVDPAPENKSTSPMSAPMRKPIDPTPPPPIVTVPKTPSIPVPLPPISVEPPAATRPRLPVIPPAPVPTMPPVTKPPITSFADVPTVPAAPKPPTPPMEEPRDKRLFNGRLLNREPAATPPAATQPAAPEEKKPGLFTRIFGPKKPAAAMPAVNVPPVPAAASAPPPPRMSAEPPRVMPSKPVAPAAPGRTDPVLPPTPMVPSVSVPAIPTPLPSVKPTAPPNTVIPTPPSIPAIPTPPALPSIPTSSQSKAPVVPAMEMKPAGMAEVVRPVGYAPMANRLPLEIQSYGATLSDALAPSARITAAKALAEGRHCSTDAVKSVLFSAAQHDPCPAVKACCIEHLCKLGYFDPAFMKHLKAACNDPSDEVGDAAKAALVKMSPR